jgi:hypothetical protein
MDFVDISIRQDNNKSPQNIIELNNANQTITNQSTNQKADRIQQDLLYSDNEISLERKNTLDKSTQSNIGSEIDSNQSFINDDSQIAEEANARLVLTVAILPILEQNISINNSYNLVNPVTIESTIPPVQPQLSDARLSLAIGGGTNLIFHQGLKSAHIYKNLKTDFGYSFNAGLDYKLSKNFSIGTGLDYNEYYTKLDDQFKDLIPNVLLDTVTAYVINPISGKVSEERGDTTVMDTLVTTIIHHNRINALTIPLMITYNFGGDRWSFGLSAGASIGFIKGYKGRFYTNDQIEFIDPNESSLYEKAIIGVNASVSAERSLNDQFAIGARIGGSKSIKAWSNEDAAYTKPMTLQGGLYLRYNF